MKKYLIHYFNFSIAFGFLFLAIIAIARPDSTEHAGIILALLGTCSIYLLIEAFCLMWIPPQN